MQCVFVSTRSGTGNVVLRMYGVVLSFASRCVAGIILGGTSCS